jgi:Family of unknown function (DUF6190)
MTSAAASDFFDASVFLGMNSDDEDLRTTSKNFFVTRFDRVVLTSLDQVGACDDVIWRYARDLQDVYYPFMDVLHSVMRIDRQPFAEADLIRAVYDRRLHRLAVGERLLIGKVVQTGGRLYSLRRHLIEQRDLPVQMPEPGPELRFPDHLETLYHASLRVRIPANELQT